MLRLHPLAAKAVASAGAGVGGVAGAAVAGKLRAFRLLANLQLTRLPTVKTGFRETWWITGNLKVTMANQVA